MEIPALAQLMGAYLHQDFDVVGSVDDNIDLFVRRSSALAASLPQEVAWLLEEKRIEDAELEAILDDMGCAVAPPEDMSYRTWLAEIAEHVRSAVSTGD